MSVCFSDTAFGQYWGARRGLGLQIAKPRGQFNLGIWGNGVQQPGVVLREFTNLATEIAPYAPGIITAVGSLPLGGVGALNDESATDESAESDDGGECFGPLESLDPNSALRTETLATIRDRQERLLKRLGVEDYTPPLKPAERAAAGANDVVSDDAEDIVSGIPN